VVSARGDVAAPGQRTARAVGNVGAAPGDDAVRANQAGAGSSIRFRNRH